MYSQRHGISTLAIVLILSTFITTMSINLALQNIEREQTLLHETMLMEVRHTVEACMEEALLKLNGNHDYTGESFYFNDVFCIIEVTDLDVDQKRIRTFAHTQGMYAKQIVADVDISSAIEIISWTAD